MFDLLESAKRIYAAYRGQAGRRVPVVAPIGWSPANDIDRQRPGDWRGEEDFVRIARMVQEHCDVAPPYNATPLPRVWAPLSYQRFGEAAMEFVEEMPVEDLGGGRTRHTTILHTPKGDLRWVYDEDEGIFTKWDIEKPIQCPADVEKMLSVPAPFDPPAPAEFEAFRRWRAEMGEWCVGGGSVNSMVAMLCGMMSFQLLLEWVLAEESLVKLLADAWLERVGRRVDWLLEQGVGPFWHFNGVERASPPMMGPRQWAKWVVPYDGEIMQRIKAADAEARIHVHCHGRVGTLLDSFIEMGVDSIDPVEPPPQGDIEMAEAKARSAGRLTLYGNIEFVDMEKLSPDAIEAKVRSAILDGGREHTVLCPTAGPHQKPTRQFIANAERYIQAGVKYGAA